MVSHASKYIYIYTKHGISLIFSSLLPLLMLMLFASCWFVSCVCSHHTNISQMQSKWTSWAYQTHTHAHTYIMYVLICMCVYISCQYTCNVSLHLQHLDWLQAPSKSDSDHATISLVASPSPPTCTPLKQDLNIPATLLYSAQMLLLLLLVLMLLLLVRFFGTIQAQLGQLGQCN